MALSPTVTYLTPDEYLALERQAEYKSEYFDGETFPMAGASENHNIIVVNISFNLYPQLRKQLCRIYTNDMRVKVSPTGSYTYPDLVAVCGERQFEDERRDTLLNPTVIVEVLSASTENYDRSLKSEHYRKLESLQEYLLVAQDKVHVEHFARQPDDQWLPSETDNLQATINLPSINCTLSLANIYDTVDLNP